MKYLCLVYLDAEHWNACSDQVCLDYVRELEGSQHLVGGEPLHPTHTATTVRVRGEQVALYDGPFAETKEMLAGFYLVEAKDLNEAIRIASGIPPAKYGPGARTTLSEGSAWCVPIPDTNWRTAMVSKNTICLWYDGAALDAARFYAETFPDSAVSTVHRAPGDYPAGKQGDVLTVEFTVIGIACLGLDGGAMFKHSEAFSFQVATDDQEETDSLWNAIIGNGGQASECGWCEDKWGLSWQITPRALTAAIADPDRAAAKRAFEAMMQMTKIDIAAIDAARRG